MHTLPSIVKKEINGKKVQAVSVRDLYEKLGLSQTHFTRWINNNLLDLYKENTDYIFSPWGEKSKGRPKLDYIVPLDVAKHLALMARCEKGKEFRQYFINAEKELQQKKIQPQISTGEETAKFFNTMIESLSEYSPTAKATLTAVVAERVYGIKVPYTMLPPVETKRYSATEIGKMLGISAQMVGRIANLLNLKNPPRGEERMSIAQHTNKEITMWYYDEEAVDRIKDHLGF